MPPAKKARLSSSGAPGVRGPLGDELQAIMARLERDATKTTRDSMARYAIPGDNALGVTVASIRALGKQIGRNHELAAALWDTGVYEARMLTSFVDDPARVTSAQMDRWAKDFDSWAICDTLCFHLFDRTPHAWDKVKKWSAKRPEFERRAAFALLWGLSGHDKHAPDARFLDGLRLIELAASDERNFVKKSVSMALRAVGRRNATLNRAAIATARRLAASKDPTARWVGKGALKELVKARLRAR